MTAPSEHAAVADPLPAGEDDPAAAVVVPIETASVHGETSEPEPVPSSVLVVVAHPDDADFGAAGTVATWTASGCRVTYCIISDGGAGSPHEDVDLDGLPELRQREQRAAAAIVGVSEVCFLAYPDGRLEPTQDLRRDLSRVIRRVRPERIISQSPERNFDRIRASHPDHLAAGEATLRAVYPDARNPFAHPELMGEGLDPFEVPEVWLMASPRSDRVVDITETFDKKVAALRSHESQLSDPDAVDGFVRNWAADTAMRFGLGEGRLAEAFQAVDTR